MLSRFVLVFALCVPTLSSVAAETVSLRGDLWCPFNCRPEAERPGFAVEIAKAAFEPAGYEVDYQLMTWSRALREARSGRIDGAIAANAIESPRLVFSKHGLGPPEIVIATRRGGAFRFSGLPSLDNARLGAVNGYRYTRDIDDHIAFFAYDQARIRLLSGGAVTDRLITLLLAERVDAIVETGVVLRYTASNAGVLAELDLTALPVDPRPEAAMSIGFTDSARGRKLAALYSDTILRLRREGVLDAIMGRYGLEDWADGPVRPVMTVPGAQ